MTKDELVNYLSYISQNTGIIFDVSSIVNTNSRVIGTYYSVPFQNGRFNLLIFYSEYKYKCIIKYYDSKYVVEARYYRDEIRTITNNDVFMCMYDI